MSDRDDTPSYVCRYSRCGGINAAYVADLSSIVTMRGALEFKADAERRGRTVEVLTVSEVRAAKWCLRECRRPADQSLLALMERENA